MALLPAELTVAGTADQGLRLGHVLGQVVIPTAFAYALFLVALWRGAKGGPGRIPTADPPASTRDWAGLARTVVVTACSGYVGFLVLVVVFYLGLGGQGPGFLRDAVVGGAFMAFAVACPAFLFIELARSLPRRRGRHGTPGRSAGPAGRT
jgi:Family of unknown function (DUF6256)